jgi:hypothetical protein
MLASRCAVRHAPVRKWKQGGPDATGAHVSCSESVSHLTILRRASTQHLAPPAEGMITSNGPGRARITPADRAESRLRVGRLDHGVSRRLNCLDRLRVRLLRIGRERPHRRRRRHATELGCCRSRIWLISAAAAAHPATPRRELATCAPARVHLAGPDTPTGRHRATPATRRETFRYPLCPSDPFALGRAERGVPAIGLMNLNWRVESTCSTAAVKRPWMPRPRRPSAVSRSWDISQPPMSQCPCP